VATPEVAEAAKLLENTFRLVNIALVYEITQTCFAAGINIQEVIDAASSEAKKLAKAATCSMVTNFFVG
jgi:UDP-N-acetyl-D-glucosamine dehydrogenase